MSFSLPDLPYAHDALEPVIDAKTMEIHHGKHHAGYVSKLNDAIKGTDLDGKSIEQILGGSKLDGPVRNNGGGHYNHSLFWPSMTSPGKGGKPEGDLAKAIDGELGGLDKFKEDFGTAAATRFGSGWAWLCVVNGKLAVCSTANQDNPLMKNAIGDAAGCGGTPILGLDVWEHAYYLNYQNRRPDYIKAFWDVVNWGVVGERYGKAKG